MNTLQGYIFRQTITPFLVILAGLALVALFTQGLAQLQVITDQQQSGLEFLWVTILGVPLLMNLIMPLALFFAVVYAINRMHSESELVVAQAAGVSNWQIASPILKLAAIAALAQLTIGALVQPAAYKEMRQALFAMREDIAASLVRPGEFSDRAKNLIVFARERRGNGELRDVMLIDRTDANRPITYVAATGRVTMIRDQPGFYLNDGQIIQPKRDGGEDVLEFSSYSFPLTGFLDTPETIVLKSSDRTLGELFYPDLTYFFDLQNQESFRAEGHHRIAGPLLNFAMAMIGLVGLLGGEFSRRGYGMRIAAAAGVALVVRVLALGIQAASANDAALNPLQYLFPLVVIAIAAVMLLAPRWSRRARAQAPPTAAALKPEPA